MADDTAGGVEPPKKRFKTLNSDDLITENMDLLRINGSGYNSSLLDDDTTNWTMDETTAMANISGHSEATSSEVVISLSLLFFVIGVVGILGNSLVIIVILIDRKMRNSVTNIFIMNLAIADLIIMIFGVPEIIQFMMNKGWIIGQEFCKFNRFVLVVALYTSVLSLVSVCIERFVAIVFPLKAQILCNRRKNYIAVSIIWATSICCGLPTVIFNEVITIPSGINFCILNMSTDDQITFKYAEFGIFYFVPVCIQLVLYAVIGVRLYASTDELHTKFQMRKENNCKTDRAAETIKARKGVVKMLFASVLVYILCYAPPQILLIYNTFSRKRFSETWGFLVFVMIIAYINSAANPVLYSIFSENFRRNFKKCLFCVCLTSQRKEYLRARFDSFDSRGLSRRISTTKTTISRL